MGRLSFDLGAAFQKAFGFTPKKFEFNDLPERKEYSKYGSPYYDVDVTGREYYMPVTLGGMLLPHPVMSITGRKSIVKTELQGRRGTVKELINIDDYQITIRGLIIDLKNEYPEETVAELRKLFERNEAVAIESAITDIFLITPDRSGFDKVVIESLDFPEVTGIRNVRPYMMQLSSDEPFDLYID